MDKPADQINDKAHSGLCKHWRGVIVACIVTLSMVFFLFLVFFNQTPGIEISGPPIPYDHLSNEERDPYLLFGREMKRDQWKRAIRQFSNVRACLVHSEQEKEMPDLRMIDWRRVTSQPVMDVCLFRIFRSYGTPKRAAMWLSAQGLEVRGPEESTRGAKRIFVLNGSNNPQQSGRKYVASSGLGGLLRQRLVYNENFSATWTQDGAIAHASYSASSK